MWKPETVPDPSPDERELDSELARIHDLAVSALRDTVWLEHYPRESSGVLPVVRHNLAQITAKVERVAEVAGVLIHGDDAAKGA